MRGASGVCQRALGPWLEASAVCSLLLIGGSCAGEALVVGEERPSPGAGGEGPGPSAVAGSAGRGGVALLEQCPTSPGQRQELLGCWPTRQVGRWRGFFIGAARHETQGGTLEEFPTGELELSLGDGGAGELTFGVVPGVEEAGPCDDLGAHPGCSPPGRLLPGFPYGLVEIELFDPEDDTQVRIAGELPLRRAERMAFRVALGQPWDSWCADQAAPKGGCGDGACAQAPTPPGAPPAADPGATESPAPPPGCRCGAEGCRPDAPMLSFELRMSEDGDALRGTYIPSDPSVGTVSLELTRER
jgi:hypothetical protein